MARWFLQTSAAGYLLLALVFIYLPVVILVLFSFQSGDLPVPPFDGPSMRWYRELFANERLLDSLINSVVVAVASAIGTTALGYLAAYGLSRSPVRFMGAARFLLNAPITVSYLIIGMGLLTTFNVIGFQKSLLAVTVGHIVINLPLAFAILYSQMNERHKNIDSAAHDLGASDLQTIVLISIPMMKVPLIASFCLSATLSWDEFIVAFLLSRFEVTLPVIVYEMLRAGLTPEVNAAGTLVFAISMAVILVAAVALTFRRGER
ncbi:MAG: ABC transporter permease [Alphaproteobacteria bacterium]|nr:ABC transporter permease [Alphaproteobacteria bacterium]